MRSRIPTAAVVASAVLLCIVLVSVAGNAVFVRRTVLSMRERVESLPAVPDAGVPGELDELSALFDRREIGLSLSVSFPILDRVREQIAAARAYAITGSEADYTAAIAVLKDVIRDLDRLERFSARNIM